MHNKQMLNRITYKNSFYVVLNALEKINYT